MHYLVQNLMREVNCGKGKDMTHAPVTNKIRNTSSLETKPLSHHNLVANSFRSKPVKFDLFACRENLKIIQGEHATLTNNNPG
jgi:hypothetical protein